MQRILVTGPVDSVAEYVDAANEAGWEASSLPLLEIVRRSMVAGDEELMRCDLICVTSSNALPALVDALARCSPLRARPLWIVGEASRERARALGLVPCEEPATDVRDLARRVLARTPRPAHVLWPRGDASDELARLLRADGLLVLDPVVYETIPLVPAAPPPPAEAVFFASPSAVRAWASLAGSKSHPASTAIAIGATTLDALLAETRCAFRDILSLPEPTSAALGHVLRHLEPTP